MVKANAYGTELGAPARPLAAAGCRTFFVAHLSEGLAARAVLPEAAIYILNGLPPARPRPSPGRACARSSAAWTN